MDKELKLMLYAFIPPAFLVLMMWFVKYLEYSSGFGFFELGVYPRHWEGLRGILASPFIHADISHLISNSIPLLLLGAGLIYFYHSLAFRVFALIFLLSGCGLWIGGREVYHIGASGLVYGLAFFLFVSGVLRGDTRLLAISLLVVFWYGSMVWGVFPLWRGVSWEGHLFGSLAGILCAFVYRHEGPQRPLYSWEMETEEEVISSENSNSTETNTSEDKEIKINYIYKTPNQDDYESPKN